MRTKIFTTLLSGLGALALNSATALADDSTNSGCTHLMVLGVQGGYPYQDFGFDASKGKPVTQDMLALTCGHLTADWWSSAQLTGGTYGHRGKGDEHDFELTYANSANTPIGQMNYSVYAAYFALDLGKGLGSTADDYAQVYGEVSRPFSIGSWTLAPFARYAHNFPMSNNYPSINWVRLGARLNGPITLPLVGEMNISLEAAHAMHLDPVGVVLHQEIWRGEADLSKSFGDQWTGTIGIKTTEYVGATPLVKVAYSF